MPFYRALVEYTIIRKRRKEESLPDCDENDALRLCPGGSRMSRYLDTMRTDMKYNSARERN